MRHLGALGLAVSVAVMGGVGAPAPPTLHLLAVDHVSARYDVGVARIRGGWVMNGPSVIVRTDELFHELAVDRSPIPERFHRRGYTRIGDVDVAAPYVYAPLETSDGRGRQVIARYDLTTLRFVDATQLPQRETPFIAVDHLRLIAYTADPRRPSVLLRYDVVRNWKPLPMLVLRAPVPDIRAAALGGGDVWVSTGGKTAGVYLIDERTGSVQRVGRLGRGARGIDATSLGVSHLHVVTVGGTHRRVLLRHFQLT